MLLRCVDILCDSIDKIIQQLRCNEDSVHKTMEVTLVTLMYLYVVAYNLHIYGWRLICALYVQIKVNLFKLKGRMPAHITIEECFFAKKYQFTAESVLHIYRILIICILMFYYNIIDKIDLNAALWFYGFCTIFTDI